MGPRVQTSNPSSVPLQPEVTETKTTSDPKAKTPQDAQPKTESPPKREINQQHAAEKKEEQNIKGNHRQQELNKKIPVKSTDAAKSNEKVSNPSTPATENLPKQAHVTRGESGNLHFDFGRTLTKEQAAHLIFKDGKIPDAATLEQGPGPNSWTVKTSNLKGQQTAVNQMRTRMEAPIPGKSNEWIVQWTDVPKNVAAEPKRYDLNNDFGFKVTKRYSLDEGQAPAKHVTSIVGKGKGFEVLFEKPMTKDQVMEKIFDKNKLGQGAVQLKPIPFEPAVHWEIHVIGADASTAYKHPVGRAFQDASAYAKESVRPSIPSGIQAHMSNKTIPKDGVSNPKGTNIYVWEQDGHLVRAQKGTDGKFYNYETTRLSENNEQSNDTMRYFMKEKGMRPREAWQEHVKHWDDIHRQMLMAMMNAYSSGRMPGKLPGGGAPTHIPRVVRKPGTKVGLPGEPPVAPGANTKVGNPPPMPGARTDFKPASKLPGHAQNKHKPPEDYRPPHKKGQTLPGSYYKKAGEQPTGPPPEIPWFPKKSGTPLTADQVKQIHKTDGNRVAWSMNPDEHLKQWKIANPNSKEPPPIAFTTPDGRVVVNEKRWLQSGEPVIWFSGAP